MYIYIYIYICMHIHIHTYIYIYYTRIYGYVSYCQYIFTAQEVLAKGVRALSQVIAKRSANVRHPRRPSAYYYD